MRCYVCVMILWLVASAAGAQMTMPEADPAQPYLDGLEHFSAGHYAAAQQSFGLFVQQYADHGRAPEAEYYRLLSKIRSGQLSMEADLSSFEENHPQHGGLGALYFEWGMAAFGAGKDKVALQGFDKAPLASLDREQRMALYYHRGYIHFASQQWERAQADFGRVKRGTSQWAAKASYYAGFINYRQGEYGLAIQDFERAEQDEEMGPQVPQFRAACLYAQERYDDLEAYVQPYLNGQKVARNTDELALLAAEAAFRKKEYARALSQYELIKQRSSSLPAPVQYRVGYSYWKTNQPAQAETWLSEAALGQDSLAQLASYYLGSIYLDRDNKPFARSALQNAVANASSAEVTADATLALAKVELELTNADRSVQLLEGLVAADPAVGKTAEVQNVLIQAYLETGDVDTALRYLEAMDRRSPRMLAAFQQATYRKGVQLFNAEQFAAAVAMFDKSLTYPEDRELAGKAMLWKGEAFSIGQQWQEAIEAYSRSLDQLADPQSAAYLQGSYGLAYALFNTRQYNQARTYFQAYVDNLRHVPGQRHKANALLRLADCQLVTKRYGAAVNYYDQAVVAKTTDADHAMYHKGLALKFANNPPRAEGQFQGVLTRYPASPWADDAAYQLALLSFERGDYSAAIASFGSMVTKFEDSPLVPLALAKRALAYTNQQNYGAAERDYARVLRDYPNHPAAEQALSGMQQVLVAQNRASDYGPYLQAYKVANPDNQAVESLELEAARSLYLSGDYKAAITAFRNYLAEYPNSAEKAEVNFLLAESYYWAEDPAAALGYYQKVIEADYSPRLSRALLRAGQIAQGQGGYAQSTTYFEQLLAVSTRQKEKNYARLAILDNLYAQQEMAELGTRASQVMGTLETGSRDYNRAQLMLTKSYLGRGDTTAAVDEILSLANRPADAAGAEAQYLWGKIYYEQGKYNQAIETLYVVNDRFGAFDDWVGRSFLLLADIYQAQNELLQAKVTLESLVDRSPNEEIKTEAAQKLEEVLVAIEARKEVPSE